MIRNFDWLKHSFEARSILQSGRNETKATWIKNIWNILHWHLEFLQSCFFVRERSLRLCNLQWILCSFCFKRCNYNSKCVLAFQIVLILTEIVFQNCVTFNPLSLSLSLSLHVLIIQNWNANIPEILVRNIWIRYSVVKLKTLYFLLVRFSVVNFVFCFNWSVVFWRAFLVFLFTEPSLAVLHKKKIFVH